MHRAVGRAVGEEVDLEGGRWTHGSGSTGTALGRLRIRRTERSLRELGGAVPGREDPAECWREDLDRYHRGERAALGRAYADSARQIERRVREACRSRLRDAERRGRAAPETKEREGPWAQERGRNIVPIPARTPRLRAWRGRDRAMTLDIGVSGSPSYPSEAEEPACLPASRSISPTTRSSSSTSGVRPDRMRAVVTPR